MKDLIEFLTKNWKVIGIALGVVSAASIFPYRLQAVEKKAERHDEQIQAQAEQATAIYKWIEQEELKRKLEEEHEAEMKAAAPKGFVWDSVAREYVRNRKK